jgi:hypothetical protein
MDDMTAQRVHGSIDRGIDAAIAHDYETSLAGDQEIYFTNSTVLHLHYLFAPVGLRLRSPEDLERWKDDYGPFPEPYQDLEYADIDSVISFLVSVLLTSLAEARGVARGVFTPIDLYSEINISPLMRRLLGSKVEYRPVYSILHRGEVQELELDDDTLGGILVVAQGDPDLTVVERHPAYVSPDSPAGEILVDDILYRYLIDRAVPYEETKYYPYAYSAVISNPGRDVTVTFPDGAFLQGVMSAATWLGREYPILSVVDTRSGLPQLIQ